MTERPISADDFQRGYPTDDYGRGWNDAVKRVWPEVEAARQSIEALREVRLLAEQWKRSGDRDTRIMGADLVQILDGGAHG